ncbi:voltage-gated purine nucleotide uniporter SLC17A9-like [Chironomus tepperi]|uniref:voltage-gated purine nucleotide uniporter SLC17A9-like n=1 Tax=Chironomus tepperi TaxID=113505 RepID=UPI00391F2C54
MLLENKLKYTLIRNSDGGDSHWNRSEKRRWFLTLFFGTCMLYSTRTTMPLVIPKISAEKNWSKSNSGTILSSFFWGYTITQVAGGYLSDKYGGERVIFIASIFWSIITIAMPNIIEISSYFQSFSMFFIVAIRVIHGFSQGFHFASMISVTSQNLNVNERTNFFSLLTSGSAFGTLMTGFIGTFLLDYFGWPFVFQVIGFLALSWALLLRYYTMSYGRHRIINISSELCIKNCGANEEVPWLRMLSSCRLWACLLTQACEMNCFFTLLSWLPTFFNESFPHKKAYLVNMLPWIAVLIFTIIAKNFTERMIAQKYHLTTVRKTVQAICFIVQNLSLFIVMNTKDFTVALISMCICMGIIGFHNSGVTVNPQDLSPEFSGSVFGLMNTFGSTFGFLGVYIAGHMLELTQNWNAVFNIIILINTFGLFIFSAFGSAEAIT